VCNQSQHTTFTAQRSHLSALAVHNDDIEDVDEALEDVPMIHSRSRTTLFKRPPLQLEHLEATPADVAADEPVKAAAADGEVRGRATPARGGPRRGRRRPHQPATARVSGLWACERRCEK
jgi:hypothetical protein